jgi:uncharacterized protein (DUF983 family)
MSATASSPLLRGLAGRCPACGRGALFNGFIQLAPRCPVCGTDLSRPGSAEDPYAFIVLIVGCIVVGAALAVEIAFAWPVWLHMLVWLPLALALCLGLLRPTRGLLAAIQYCHRRHEIAGNG